MIEILKSLLVDGRGASKIHDALKVGVIILAYLMGFNVSEIAGKMGISKSKAYETLKVFRSGRWGYCSICRLTPHEVFWTYDSLGRPRCWSCNLQIRTVEVHRKPLEQLQSGLEELEVEASK